MRFDMQAFRRPCAIEFRFEGHDIHDRYGSMRAHNPQRNGDTQACFDHLCPWQRKRCFPVIVPLNATQNSGGKKGFVLCTRRALINPSRAGPRSSSAAQSRKILAIEEHLTEVIAYRL